MQKINRIFELTHKENVEEQIICNECNGEKRHNIVASYNVDYIVTYNGDTDSIWYSYDQIIKCRGCDTISFRTVFFNSEDIDRNANNEPYSNKPFTYYPARSQGLKTIETDMLPPEVWDIYKETILAINNQQNILAGIGIRAIVETICTKHNPDGKNLKEKIKYLKKQSIITSDGEKILHKLRDLGNDSAHEVKAHNSEQLVLAMKVINNILEATYIIPNEVRSEFPDKK